MPVGVSDDTSEWVPGTSSMEYTDGVDAEALFITANRAARRMQVWDRSVKNRSAILRKE